MKQATIPALEPLMSSYQRKIIEDAPRSLFFYVAGRRAGLIPDTPKARQWAVEERCATHFDMFSFHRLSVEKKPCIYKVGDFYCVIRTKSNQHIGSSSVLKCIISELTISFRLIDLSPCKFISLGRHALGLSIPASVFGIEHGSETLPYLYKSFLFRFIASILNRYPEEFDIDFSDRIHAENHKIGPSIYAVPFLMAEAGSFSESFLESISKAPRVTPAVKCYQTIDADILKDLKLTALNSWHRNPNSGTADNMSFKPNEPTPLGAPIDNASICTQGREYSAMNCARKLVSKIYTKGVCEFRRRDALRALTGSECLNGKSGNGGGVADALAILTTHNYIKVCPILPIDYRCGRASPWYVVNPALHSVPGVYLG